ncbi:MAG: cytochrome c maturation protein CcmE [Legionellaceae bacterium]|nr:cytochrome c maturation protein CcmE [Legionellaceae bacterium]
MKAVRRRKLSFILFVLTILSLVVALIMYALRQNVSLFYSPTELVHLPVSPKIVRLGGMVVKNSVKRQAKTLEVEFKLTDFHQTITVRYQGILPDLFREEQGIVALGYVGAQHVFKATEVLAKHDENYMPPEVKFALKSGQNYAR